MASSKKAQLLVASSTNVDAIKLTFPSYLMKMKNLNSLCNNSKWKWKLSLFKKKLTLIMFSKQDLVDTIFIKDVTLNAERIA